MLKCYLSECNGHESEKSCGDKLSESCSKSGSLECPQVAGSESQDNDALIDWQDLENRIQDEALISKIIAVFLDSYPERFECLAQAVRTGRSQDVHAHAHALKGAAASVGATPLSEMAYQLERAGKEGDVQAFESLFERTQVQFDRLRSFLSQSNWIEIAKQNRNNE